MKNKITNIVKSVIRYLVYALGLTLLIFALFFVLLRFYVIQEYFVNSLTQNISGSTEHQINVGQVNVDWFDQIRINTITVDDLDEKRMLSISDLIINYDLWDLLSRGDFTINGIYIEKNHINLRKNTTSQRWNVEVFLNSLREGQREGSLFDRLLIENLNFHQTVIRLEDLSETQRNSIGIDSNYKEVIIDELLIEKLQLQADSVVLNIASLVAYSRFLPSLSIKSFEGKVILNHDQINFKEFSLQTENSHIGSSLSVDFNRGLGGEILVDSLKFNLALVNSVVDLQELSSFLKTPLKSTLLQLEMDVKGDRSVLEVSRIHGSLESGSFIMGKASIRDIMDLSAMEVVIDVESSMLAEEDVNFFTKSYHYGPMNYQGDIKWNLDHLVVNGLASAAFGKFRTDISLENWRDIESIGYAGSINFNLTHLTDLTGIQGLGNAEGTVNLEGNGLTLGGISAKALMNIKRAAYLDKVYEKIDLTVELGDDFLNFSLLIDDADLQGAGKGIFHTGNRSQLDVDLMIAKANLKNMHFSKERFDLESNMSLHLMGINSGNLVGDLNFHDLNLFMGDEFFSLGPIKLDFDTLIDQRIIIESQDIDLIASGDFELKEITKDLFDLFQRYRNPIYLEPQGKTVIAINQIPYKSSLKAHISERVPMGAFLGLNLDMRGEMDLDVMFEKNSHLAGNIHFEKLKIDEHFFYSNDFSISVNDDKNNDLAASLSILSKGQSWRDMSATSNLSCLLDWKNDSLNGELHWIQSENGFKMALYSQLILEPKMLHFKLLPSTIEILNQPWVVNQSNSIKIDKKNISIAKFELSQSNQLIGIQGIFDEKGTSKLDLYAHDFELMNLAPIINLPINGKVNGTAELKRLATEDHWSINSDVNLLNLGLDNHKIGDLSGSFKWLNLENRFATNLRLVSNNVETACVSGFILPFNDLNQIDLLVQFDNMRVNWLETFFKNKINGVDGFANGVININGLFTNPQLIGQATLFDGMLTLDYLNTKYFFSGTTYFDKNRIDFGRVSLSDRYQGEGQMIGHIILDRLRAKELDLNLIFQNIEVLNTVKNQNKLYYGTAFGTGDAHFFGPISEMIIDLNVKTDANTRIKIPLESQSEFELKDYIIFNNPQDISTLSNVKIEALTATNGIQLNMNLEVTDQAYAELIFNDQTGDIIRGKGEGNLLVKISSLGEFELLGQVEIKEGAYNWTSDFLNKEFQIIPGGIVSFSGDPYKGVIAIEASYRQLADPNSWTGQKNETSKKGAVLVILALDGLIDNLNLNFKLALDNSDLTSNSNTELYDIITAINANDLELKRQVFSLLVLKQFAPNNSLISSDQLVTGFGNSVSEFVSSQLSYWLNGVDDNLDVSIDLAKMDQTTAQIFELRLGYTFLEGRLRLEGGSFLNKSQNKSSGVGNFIGDWAFDYILTEDGRLRLKIFSQTNQFYYPQNNSVQAGLSLQYVRSFNKLKELLQISKKKRALLSNEENLLIVPISK